MLRPPGLLPFGKQKAHGFGPLLTFLSLPLKESAPFGSPDSVSSFPQSPVQLLHPPLGCSSPSPARCSQVSRFFRWSNLCLSLSCLHSESAGTFLQSAVPFSWICASSSNCFWRLPSPGFPVLFLRSFSAFSKYPKPQPVPAVFQLKLQTAALLAAPSFSQSLPLQPIKAKALSCSSFMASPFALCFSWRFTKALSFCRISSPGLLSDVKFFQPGLMLLTGSPKSASPFHRRQTSAFSAL